MEAIFQAGDVLPAIGGQDAGFDQAIENILDADADVVWITALVLLKPQAAHDTLASDRLQLGSPGHNGHRGGLLLLFCRVDSPVPLGRFDNVVEAGERAEDYESLHQNGRSSSAAAASRAACCSSTWPSIPCTTCCMASFMGPSCAACSTGATSPIFLASI